jgi:hypothetical protein
MGHIFGPEGNLITVTDLEDAKRRILDLKLKKERL